MGMKLPDHLKSYKAASGKLSAIVRQLAFAGIATIWIFKIESDGRQSIPSELIKPATLLVASLALDLLHLICKTLAWGGFVRYHELINTSHTEDIDASRFINWPGNFFFFLKVVVMAVAYFYLLQFLKQKFWV
jgi:hypothetical protein